MKTAFFIRFSSFVALLLLAFGSVRATHIVGGELNYRYIGVNTYEISLTIYRDCDSLSIGYDSQVWVGIFDKNNVAVDSLLMTFPDEGAQRIPMTSNAKCATITDSVCYEVAVYMDTIVLPPRIGGYQLSHQRCCWNLSVTNIVNTGPNPGGNSGLTIYCRIPDVNQIRVNSNPVFQVRTPPFICRGTRLEFDHAAFDPDGDSLSYEIFTPWDGDARNGGEYPDPPPYDEVRYTPKYGLDSVMGSEDPLKIDRETGWLTARPEDFGQYVFGVEVREHRNGEYIGSTWRSYQLNAGQCGNFTSAEISTPDIFCAQNRVKFENKSIGASTFEWNFGDPSNSTAGSTNVNPSYTYPGSGTYTVRLIAFSDLDSAACDDTTFKDIEITDEFKATANYTLQPCSNNVSFFGDATPIAGARYEWQWDFGDGETSLMQNPTHFYENIKSYNIFFASELKGAHEGCGDTVLLVFSAKDWLPAIEATASKASMFRRADSVFLMAQTNSLNTIEWTPAEGLSDAFISNPIAKPQTTTIYKVTVTDTTGCSNSDTVGIFVNPYRCGESEVFVPNAFTPNNDGENDFLRVRGEDIQELYFAIYNRWGEVVYESTDINMISEESKGWDGKHKGNDLSPGVFVYYLKAVCKGQNEFLKKGNITLIR